MIFYPETGPQCPALPAGQACSVSIGRFRRSTGIEPADSLAANSRTATTSVVLSGGKPSSRSWNRFSCLLRRPGMRRHYLTTPPIFHAAGLNIGKGAFVVSDGLRESSASAGSLGESGGGGNGRAGTDLISALGTVVACGTEVWAGASAGASSCPAPRHSEHVAAGGLPHGWRRGRIEGKQSPWRFFSQ